MRTATFDIECYRDYFLVSFLNIDTGNVTHVEMFDGQALDEIKLRKILANYRLVSFNGNNYDLPILSLALSGADNAMLKEASDLIIKTGLKHWHLEEKYQFKVLRPDHIDLIEVAPGMVSLKIYGGRLHTRTMQDLPIEPEASITPEQRAQLREYCANDLRVTAELYAHLTPQIELRARMSDEYGIDLRSKSDAQIAEAVIRARVQAITGFEVERPEVLAGAAFRYRTPPWVSFATPALQDMLRMVESARFIVPDTGKVVMPKELAEAKIAIGASTYRMGIGGLHSCEKSIAHRSDDTFQLLDRDVASYYPSIILNLGLQPQQMGAAFTATYKQIVQRRLAAKHAGDKVTADALKITINGSFGKFGSKWSTLFSPTLLIQVTLTGQLALLMLIEMLEQAGIAVVSANTDGVVIKCPHARYDECESIIAAWEICTGFETEEALYDALYSRDVNNYIAIKPDGKFKLKGVYAFGGISKNPTNEICTHAVVRHLVDGTPVEHTIDACKDITKFITIRSVKGGAVKDDRYLGRAVRWYYSLAEAGTIKYKVNGYNVPRSEGAAPLMELPDRFPDDIDLGWYITEANNILKDIGA